MKNKSMIIPYSLSHFLVDFACASFMFQHVYGTSKWYILVILYNFCAFALQMPIGLLVDKWNKNAIAAAAGCLSVALAYITMSFAYPSVILLGIGNALFHVGGGTDVLNSSTEKASMLGVFVSPGAFGIYFGTMLGKQGKVSTMLFLLVLLIAAVIILLWDYMPTKSFVSNNVEVSFESATNKGALLAIICFFIVVILRSYMGMKKFTWGGEANWGAFLICAVVFGKMIGGFLGDRFGIKQVAFLSLAASAILFVFSENIPALGVLGMFCFNMTMPLTLWAIARVLKDCKGFSFGLLTVALFLGMLPAYLSNQVQFHTAIGCVVVSIVSLVIIMIGIKKVVK